MKNIQGVIAGLLLILASVLKIHQLATTPFLGNFFSDSRELNIAFAFVELTLGFWLASGWNGNTSRKFAIGVFLAFFISTLVMLVRGAESCGCFGVLVVHPIVTLLIDVVVLLVLTLWRPKCGGKFPVVAASIYLASLAFSFWIIFQFEFVSFDDIGTVANEEAVIIMEEDGWVNKPLPIFGLLVGREKERLLKGDWQIIFYHTDCPKCQKLIDNASKLEKKTAFVEIPPYRNPAATNSDTIVWMKLSDRYDWFVKAPAIVFVRDGIVLADRKP